MDIHKKILKLYSLSPGGNLSTEEKTEINTHIAGCAQCREDTGLLRKTWETLSVLTAPEPSAGFEAKLRRNIESHRRAENTWEKAVRLAPAMGMAIWIAGLVTGGLLFVKDRSAVAGNDPLKLVLGSTLPGNSLEKIYLGAGKNS